MRIPWTARRYNQSILKEISPIIGRTDAEVEMSILWPPDVKSRLTRKYPDTWKGIIQEEKGMTEDEMFRWNHQLNGHEYEQAPGDGYI